MLESKMYLPNLGFGKASRCLAGLPHSAFQARLAALGFVRVTLTFSLTGDQLTWGILDDLDIPWGDNTTLVYEHLQPGWVYDWNVDTQTFLVTDDTGIITRHEGVGSLSGLGISWEILLSKQFHIYRTKVIIIEDSSLYGTRVDSKRVSQRRDLYWPESDYLGGNQHAVFDLLAGYSLEGPGVCKVNPVLSDGSEARLSDILLADTDELNFKNYYPVNLYGADNPQAGERQSKEMPGVLDAYSTLMIMCFAERLLSVEAHVLYEPWMLYAIFQWLYHRPNVVKKDSIFDLSPWWG